MAQRKRRGFTIVELVIVIAVIAILAGVLIPTFISVINKANVASDTSLVKNINEALVAEEVTEGKPATMYEALQRAEANGFTIEKLTPRSTGDIVWNSESNRFALVDGDKTVYSFNGEEIVPSAKIWKIVATADEAKNNKYSSYIKGNAVTGDIVVGMGVDVGVNTGITSIKYASTSNQEVVIRTNGGTLIVDAPSGTVYHHKLASKVIVENVHTDSYHECGFVTDYIEAKTGHVVIESGASVSILAINGSATVDQNSGSELFKVVPVGSTTIDTSKVKVLEGVTVDTASVSADDLANIKYGGGLGTQAAPYELYTASQLAAFAKDVNDGKFETYVYAKLCANVDLSGIGWDPIGNGKQPFYGSFDGQNHIISGLTNNGFTPSEKLWGITTTAKNIGVPYGFFGVVGLLTNDTTAQEIVLKNVKFENVNIASGDTNMMGTLLGADVAAATIGDSYVNQEYAGNVTIENVSTNGSISVTNETTVGGIVGKLYTKGTAKVANCVNSCAITATEIGKYAGVVGYTVAAITMTDCKNNGKITVASSLANNSFVAGIATIGANSSIVVKNCDNAAKLETVGYAAHILQHAGNYVTSIVAENCTASVGDLYYDNAVITYQRTKAGIAIWTDKVKDANDKYVVRIIDAMRFGYSNETGEYVAGSKAEFTADKWTEK